MPTKIKNFFTFQPSFIQKLLILALPLVAQSVCQALVGFTDVIMISNFLGEQPMAAVSLSNQIFIIILLIFFGMTSGSAIFFSRYWGQKNCQKINQVFGFSLFLNLMVAFIALVLLFIYGRPILMLIAKHSVLTTLGMDYLHIIALSLPMVGLSVTMAGFWRSIEKSFMPMIVSFISLIVSVSLNYVLILGHFGFPALGIKGAAYSTLIARTLEVVVFIAFYLSKHNPCKGSWANYLFFLHGGKERSTLISNYIRIIIPYMVADVTWALGITAYKAAYARLGTSVVAAFSAVDSVWGLFTILFFALGGACEVMMGNTIGEHKIDQAFKTANSFIRLNFILGIPFGLAFIAFSPFMPKFFTFTGDAALYVQQASILNGLFFSLRCLEYFLTVGILRSGGDSRFNFFAQTFTLWCVGVPAVFIAIFYFNASPAVVYLIVILEEVLRDTLFYIRYKTKKWIHLF